MRKPLPSEMITLVIYREKSIVEQQGKVKGSRLWAQASGLDIYVIGNDPDKHPDCLPNMAINACIARHIPLLSLHVLQHAKRELKLRKTDTKEMF